VGETKEMKCNTEFQEKANHLLRQNGSKHLADYGRDKKVILKWTLRKQVLVMSFGLRQTRAGMVSKSADFPLSLQDCLYHHPVHKISFIAQDMSDSRAFGYIYGSPDTGHRFFGIKTDKAASQVSRTKVPACLGTVQAPNSIINSDRIMEKEWILTSRAPELR